MLTQDEVMHIFENRDVILKGHFLLSSGLHSDRYVQCARIFEYPQVAEMLCGDLVEKLNGTEIDLVLGPAVGAITMAYEMGRQLGVQNMFAEREHGRMKLRRGFEIPAGARVLLVEDVITTGGSLRELLPLIEAAGASLTAVACIMDRTDGDVDFGVPMVSEMSVKVLTYEAGFCPLCKEGSIPVEHGSRHANK